MTHAEFKNKLDKTIESLSLELRSLRMGRANAQLVENISVDAYEGSMPLAQVASIQTPQHDQIVIQPWDVALLGAIESALRKSDLNLNPVVESTVIRINIPPLTEERRHDLVRLAHKYAEEGRISIRNLREEAMESIDKAEKNKEISEDDKFREKDEIQKLVDEYNKKVKELADNKEKDIMHG